MGIGPRWGCGTNPAQPAPNPNPGAWRLIDKAEFKGGYVLKVKYAGCTNYEGMKVMVYRGDYTHRQYLDPHFADSCDSPIARFRPDDEGWMLAKALAQCL